MKLSKSFILLISIMLPMKFMAQNENQNKLSLEDLIPGGRTFNKYRVEMPKQIQWWGDRLLYIEGDSVIEVPIKSVQKPQLLIGKKDINTGLEEKKKEALKNLQGISFPYPDSSIVYIKSKNEAFLYNFLDKTISASYILPENAEYIDFSDASRNIAYTRDNNLYVVTPNGEVQTVTNEDNKAIVSGQSVHRNEFGITKGTFWSPKGNFLAFYRMDESMVSDYPLVDISTRIAQLKNTKYPMAGMKSHQVTIGVYNPQTKDTVFLKTGTPKDKYLTNITWTPDEQSIFVAEINRGQDTCVMNRYSAITGKLEEKVFEEIHPKYVEPEKPVLFLNDNGQQFLWLSKRDGFNHIYLYDFSKKRTTIKQLTSGNWDVISILGIDMKNENIYYVSTEGTPIEQHIYSLNIKKNIKTKLSKEEGIHSPLLSKSRKYVCDIYSSQYNPGKIVLTETKSNKSSLFFEAKNPYRNKNIPEITLGSIKANDGKTDLYYRLVKPTDFDPTKKYPVIVYVYGGPHSQLVTNAWMGQVRGWDIYMAEKGYVIFTLDNRGTSNRGSEFENITHRQLGITETQDQMLGIDFLKSLPYIDADKIGVHGWSYGGFMTLNLMLRHSETFKVAVAGGPVTDWKYYEVMYGERYMDSPKENPEGYEETSMLNKAANLKGRLMLIHGDEDPTVVMQHSLQYLKSSIKAGTHPDFFVYPGHEHNMTGKDRVHLYEHITRYFEDHLK